MGRKIKRVALDFDWPLQQVWDGFLSPFTEGREECSECDGSGNSRAGRLLNALWYLRLYYDAVPALMAGDDIPRGLRQFARNVMYSGMSWNNNLDQADVNALIEKDRLWDFTRVPRNEEQQRVVREKRAAGENSWLPYDNGYTPTADEVNEWSRQGFGHDSINNWICVKARCSRYQVSPECPVCNGKGFLSTPELEALIEGWQPFEPPVGEGWQLWETVSEGSPVSPVFGDVNDFVDWMVRDGYSRQAAWAFVKQGGWAPSFVMVPGIGVWDGVTDAGIRAAKANEFDESEES